jgi:hypothetical protein
VRPKIIIGPMLTRRIGIGPMHLVTVVGASIFGQNAAFVVD